MECGSPPDAIVLCYTRLCCLFGGIESFCHRYVVSPLQIHCTAAAATDKQASRKWATAKSELSSYAAYRNAKPCVAMHEHLPAILSPVQSEKGAKAESFTMNGCKMGDANPRRIPKR